MDAELYEIVPCPQGRLAIAPRPRGDAGLRGELESFKARGVTDVATLLMAQEEIALGLEAQERLCGELGLGFYRLPTTDRSVPVQPAFNEFVDRLLVLLQQQRYIAIHCRAGIGRSAVTIAALLIRQGVGPEDAVERISEARGWDIPDTHDQWKFIQSLAKSP